MPHVPMVGVEPNSKRVGVPAVAVCWMVIRDEVHADPLVCGFQEFLVQPEFGGVVIGDGDLPSIIVSFHEVPQAADNFLHLRHDETQLSETPDEDLYIIKVSSLCF